MQIRRFYVDTIPAAGTAVTLPASEALHAGKVLRLGTGDRVELLDGVGARAEAVIANAGSGRRFDGMSCRVENREELEPPTVRFHLLVAPPRPKQMSHIIRCATELGVWRITPILCEHGVSMPRDSAVSGWQDDAVVAMKQSGNLFLPTLDGPRPFQQALEESAGTGVYGAVPRETADCSPFQVESGDVAVWIGPEGGFSPDEAHALDEHGLHALAVGRWILRVETAVPALLGTLLGSSRP